MPQSANTHPGKAVSETAIHDHTYRIFPNDLNAHGTVFGGLVMAMADRLAHVVAERHSGTLCVTASVDSMTFLSPAGRGDNLVFQAAINRSWHTSMEVGVKVLAEKGTSSERTHIVSAYLTFVALDKNHKPTAIPKVIAETKEEKQRFEEAELRRQNRIAQKEAMKKIREKAL